MFKNDYICSKFVFFYSDWDGVCAIPLCYRWQKHSILLIWGSSWWRKDHSTGILWFSSSQNEERRQDVLGRNRSFEHISANSRRSREGTSLLHWSRHSQMWILQWFLVMGGFRNRNLISYSCISMVFPSKEEKKLNIMKGTWSRINVKGKSLG